MEKRARNDSQNYSLLLGQTDSKAFWVNMNDLPHLFVTGKALAGKSTFLQCCMMSLLNNDPNSVKCLIIDSAILEFNIYNGIPHLLVSSVTEPCRAVGALIWTANEMLNRCKLFADNNVRDFTMYNKKCASCHNKMPMPQIIVIINELQNLIKTAPDEIEDSLYRLTQDGHHAGIHIIASTKYKDVERKFKKFFPSTINMYQEDDKYFASCDILHLGKPKTLTAPYAEWEEIEAAVKVVKKIDRQTSPEKKKSGVPSGGEDIEFGDELLPQAIECVIEMGTASTTLLQRRMRLGYARAARIMDELEQRGIVGLAEDGNHRKVLITKQQWFEMSDKNATEEL